MVRCSEKLQGLLAVLVVVYSRILVTGVSSYVGHCLKVGTRFPGGLRGRAADAALRRLQTGCFGQLGAFRVLARLRMFGRKGARRATSQDTFLVVVGVLSQWILEPFFSDVSEARGAPKRQSPTPSDVHGEVNTLILLRMARLLRLAPRTRTPALSSRPALPSSRVTTRPRRCAT